MERPLEELVKSAAAGDSDAFALLISRTQRAALAMALAVCGDADLAGEVVQEAFIRAWRRLDSLQDAGRFEPWMAQIIRNLAMDHFRHEKKTATLDETFAGVDPGQPPDHPLHQEDQRKLIDAAIARLDETSRSIVLLRYYGDLDSKEIGRLLDMSPAAVDMRLSRARNQLRENLQAHVECFDARH